MAQYKMKISMIEVCNIMSLTYEGWETASLGKAHASYATAEVRPVAGGETSKADWAEN